MTPQNKAIQLYNMFLNPSGDTFLYGMLEHESAKECAIIAVDEIINSLPPYEYGLEFVVGGNALGDGKLKDDNSTKK